MNNYPIPSVLKGPKGFKAELLSFGHDYNSPEGCVSICLRDNEKQLYQIDIPEHELSQSLLKKVLLFFRHAPSWREYFKRPTPCHGWRIGDPLSLSSYAQSLYPYLQALEKQGCTIISYNKGGNHPLGAPCHLKINRNFPDELERISLELGWLSKDQAITAKAPHGFQHLANQKFMLLLDDWYNKTLDRSTKRYLVDREERPLFPDWPPYPKSALLEQELLNKKKASKLNKYQTPTTFDDYAQLTSGRDTFSGIGLEELCKTLAGDPVLDELNEIAENPLIMAKALRWRLRGLSVIHTIEKYRVDEILHNHAEQQRENMRKEYENRTSLHG